MRVDRSCSRAHLPRSAACAGAGTALMSGVGSRGYSLAQGGNGEAVHIPYGGGLGKFHSSRVYHLAVGVILSRKILACLGAKRSHGHEHKSSVRAKPVAFSVACSAEERASARSSLQFLPWEQGVRR
ncbi:hypothetical protein ABZP36_015096 [Zizania latifolia]